MNEIKLTFVSHLNTLTQWPEALMEGVRKIGIYVSEKAPRKVYKNAKRL